MYMVFLRIIVIFDLLLFNVYGLFIIDYRDNTFFALVIDCIGLLIIKICDRYSVNDHCGNIF